MLERIATSQLPPYLLETEAAPEILSRTEVLKVGDQEAYLEITEECPTNCSDYCYGAGRFNAKARPVPFEVICRRLDWLSRFTDAKSVVLLGGEPLTHPDFAKIIDYAKNYFSVLIITSGVVARKGQPEANRRLLLSAYEAGDLDICLSYHPGRNERPYKFLFDEIKKRAPQRKANLETKLAKAKLHEESQQAEGLETRLGEYSLYTTVTLSESVARDWEKFYKVYRFIYESCVGGDISKGIETRHDGTIERTESLIQREFILIQKHFAEYEQSAPFSHTITFPWPEGLTFDARFWGAIGVSREKVDGQDVIKVKRPQGRAGDERSCPATRSQTQTASQTISLPSPTIRADGDLIFSEPSCYEGTPGLTNVDQVDDPGQIYADVSQMIRTLNKMIHVADHKHLAGHPDPENCHSCPFDSACDMCRTIKRK